MITLCHKNKANNNPHREQHFARKIWDIFFSMKVVKIDLIWNGQRRWKKKRQIKCKYEWACIINWFGKWRSTTKYLYFYFPLNLDLIKPSSNGRFYYFLYSVWDVMWLDQQPLRIILNLFIDSWGVLVDFVVVNDGRLERRFFISLNWKFIES